jgi:hypothetical protein
LLEDFLLETGVKDFLDAKAFLDEAFREVVFRLAAFAAFFSAALKSKMKLLVLEEPLLVTGLTIAFWKHFELNFTKS